MSVNHTTCPIWKTSATFVDSATIDDTLLNIDSPRAGGKYCIDVIGRAEKMFADLDNHAKARLTTWLIEQRRLGDECPEIRSYQVESIIQRPHLPVHARADELLKCIQERTPFVGEKSVVPNRGDSSNELLAGFLAYTESIELKEMLYLLNYLIGQGWLISDAPTINVTKVIITVEGYARLAELENVRKATSQAFVAMWFDESLDLAFEVAFEPAIKNAGYTAVRVDRQEHIGKIDDQIIAEIRRSSFVIVDFTQGTDGARGGVYYEAGFAHGLDIPVIFTCRSDSIEDVHFDTRQYNHIIWDSLESLKERLENRIAAVIGDGPLKSVPGEQEIT